VGFCLFVAFLGAPWSPKHDPKTPPKHDARTTLSRGAKKKATYVRTYFFESGAPKAARFFSLRNNLYGVFEARLNGDEINPGGKDFVILFLFFSPPPNRRGQNKQNKQNKQNTEHRTQLL
jgi:hypothetical protein